MSLERARAEIIRLHDFFTGWYKGAIPRTALETDFTAVMHPEFQLIMPAGKVYTKDDIVEVIDGGHGQNPDFRITIETVELAGTWPGLILASYIERQEGAKNSAAVNRRRSTVLFEAGDDWLLWRHLQETWVS
ncbi:MAG: DUF4440 domain-containing protein [Pseudomonadota bacterium]